MSIDEQEIYREVRSAIADTLRISAQQVTPDALLFHELGAASLDFVDIEFRLETHFGIELYHGSAVDRIAELLAPQLLEEQGVLTPFGARVLRKRMPEVPLERLQPGQPAAGIEHRFTARTFLRAVAEVLKARPRLCPRCSGLDLVIARPSVLLCQSCGTEVRCPTGEDCLQQWVADFAADDKERAADAA
jgi:acyl carrier protein